MKNNNTRTFKLRVTDGTFNLWSVFVGCACYARRVCLCGCHRIRGNTRMAFHLAFFQVDLCWHFEIQFFINSAERRGTCWRIMKVDIESPPTLWKVTTTEREYNGHFHSHLHSTVVRTADILLWPFAKVCDGCRGPTHHYSTTTVNALCWVLSEIK